jgi:hypothetical protein
MPICLDCTYFQSESWPKFKGEDCKHPHWILESRCHPTKRKQVFLTGYYNRKPSNYNSNCDCKLYKRKWWKIWH